MLELFSYYRSSAAYRLRIALNLKGLDYRLSAVNLARGEQLSRHYRSLNPQGLVPVLATGEGAHLTQSVAIMEWLEETHPEPPLLPAEPLARARVRAMVNTVACDIHPLNNLRVLRYLERVLEVGEGERSGWYHHWLRQGFLALEQQVSGARRCWGDAVTMADVCLVPQIYNARRFAFDLSAFPRLVAIAGALAELAAFAEAAPERQPDAPRGN
jgi:maleylpyruvate isomerase